MFSKGNSSGFLSLATKIILNTADIDTSSWLSQDGAWSAVASHSPGGEGAGNRGSVVAALSAVGISSSLSVCSCLPSGHTFKLKFVASVIG